MVGKIYIGVKDKNSLDTSDKKTVIAAIYYMNYNKPLHEFFGFDIEKYPNILFDSNSKQAIPQEEFAERYIEPMHDINVFHVYSDIIKESYIGNVKANILRIFPRNKLCKDETLTYYFDKNMFIPLRVDEINSIKISIRNNLADVMKYKKGNISATLLIRPLEYI